MHFPVVKIDLEIHHAITSDDAFLTSLINALLHRWNKHAVHILADQRLGKFDARVARLFNERGMGRRGGWPYIMIGVREGCTYQGVEYSIEFDGEARRVRALLIAFANGREYGMGACLAPLAELDDGLLDATVVEYLPMLARFWDARHLAMGTAHRAKSVTTKRVVRAVIEADGPMEFHVDGEVAVQSNRIEVEIVPGALKVRAAPPA